MLGDRRIGKSTFYEQESRTWLDVVSGRIWISWISAFS